jgi:hypothetical protein
MVLPSCHVTGFNLTQQAKVANVMDEVTIMLCGDEDVG